jgi:hypothetical protein
MDGKLLTMTSTLSSSNGRAVMSAVCSSMRSATFSSAALARVADGELPVWSGCQKSTPMARPRGSRFVAASNTAPRPHPMSSTVSSPRSRRSSRIRFQTTNLPARVA